MLGFTKIDNAQDWEDERVLAAAQSSPWLFSIIVERYEAAFTRKVRGVLRDARDVEEVVQDAFTKIYINADKYEPQSGAKFSSWAYRILMNTAFTRYQKMRKEGERFAAIDPEYEQLFGEWAEHSGFEAERDAVERILARLPGHFAHVLQLHYLERWSHQDIADSTKENVGTIKARIHRAKAAFRKEVRDGEVTL